MALALGLILTLFKLGECPQDFRLDLSPKIVAAKVGSNVILSCQTKPERNIFADVIVWTHDGKTVFRRRKGMDDQAAKDKLFKNRSKLFPPEMDKGNCSLQLFNVTKGDNGTYDFKILNLKNLNGTVELTVDDIGDSGNRSSEPEPENTPNNGTNVGPIVGVGVGVLLIVLIGAGAGLYFCTKKNKEKKGEQQQNKDPRDDPNELQRLNESSS